MRSIPRVVSRGDTNVKSRSHVPPLGHRSMLPRAVVKYVLFSLLAATVAILPFEGDPEPGSLPRLVWVVTFFAVFTLCGMPAI